MKELGYQILAVSPDDPDHLLASSKKYSLSYTLLSDSHMKAARAFGIAFKVNAETLEKFKSYGINLDEASGQSHHMLPVPAAYVFGTDGVVKFMYFNEDYKVRVKSVDLLAAAKSAVAGALVATQK